MSFAPNQYPSPFHTSTVTPTIHPASSSLSSLLHFTHQIRRRLRTTHQSTISFSSLINLNMFSRRISSLFLTTLAARVSTNNAFTINSISRASVSASAVQGQGQVQVGTARPYSFSKSALFAAVPEPGPCPECSDDNAYWDGASNFACIACGHEWPVDSPDEASASAAEGDGIVRDANGTPIEPGDTVVLTQALGKGLKKGMKILKIRVGDYGDGHDCQANIPGLGTFNLKSQFLKKTS